MGIMGIVGTPSGCTLDNLTVDREDVTNEPKHYPACKQVAVKAIEQTPMARNQVGGIFHACLSLHRTLQQVAKEACEKYDDALHM
jgi:hypothetical protein